MSNIFIEIFNLSISAGLAATAVIILRMLMRKVPRWIHCIMWSFVGIRLVLPFSPKSIFSLIPSAKVIPSDIASSQSPHIESGYAVIDSAINPFIKDVLAQDSQSGTNLIEKIISAASLIWIAGVIAMIIYMISSYLSVRKKVGASIHLKDNIYISDFVSSPFILGVISPRIYLPSGLDESFSESVIMHEKAHIKRLDHIIKPISFLLLSVYWINPILWVAYILLCRDIEKACDEKVIKTMDSENKRLYSEALLSCSVKGKLITACPLAFGETDVKSRIKNILSYKKPYLLIIIVSVVIIFLTAICLLTDPPSKNNNSADVTTSAQNTDYPYTVTMKDYTIFIATVKTEGEKSITVEPFVGSYERLSASRIELYAKKGQDIDFSRFRVGDEVTIAYDGGVLETYPAKIDTVLWITNRNKASVDYNVKIYDIGYIGSADSLKSGAVNSDAPYAHLIESRDELISYLGLISRAADPAVIEGIKSEYTGDYFENRSLIGVYYPVSSSTLKISGASLGKKDNTVNMFITPSSPIGGATDDAMGGYLVLYNIDVRNLKNVTSYTVTEGASLIAVFKSDPDNQSLTAQNPTIALFSNNQYSISFSITSSYIDIGTWETKTDLNGNLLIYLTYYQSGKDKVTVFRANGDMSEIELVKELTTNSRTSSYFSEKGKLIRTQ